MLINYIIMAIRSLWSNKLHAVINMLGLSLGIAVTLLIGGFVLSELHVNRDLKDVDRTYVIESQWSPQNLGVFYTTLGPLASTLKAQFPQLVDDSYRYTLASTIMSAANGKIFKEQLQIGDAAFMSMFGFTLLHGKAASAFANDGIVLTASVAKKYFGRSDVLGEVLTIQKNSGEKVDCQITGVLQDMTSNSVVNFAGNPTHNEIFLSMNSLKFFMGDAAEDWGFKYMVSIVKVVPGVTTGDLDGPLKQIISSHAPEEFKKSLVCELKPLADYYLQWGNGRMLKMIRTLSAVAIFIVLLVMANFISIMISAAAYRLREIGLRKLFGGRRRQLVAQFLTESILISLIAMLFALVLYVALRPAFQDLLDKPLAALHEFEGAVFLWILLLAVFTGALAGLYPAIRLSSFKIVTAVRGKLPAFGEGKFIRKSMLCFQLTVAAFALICSVVIAEQLQFIRQFDLGYHQEGVLVITSVPRAWDEKGVSKLEAIRAHLSTDANIISASISYEVPDGNAGNRYNFLNDQGKAVDMPLLNVDENFAQTFGLKLIAGKFFHHANGSYESNRIVLNEQAAKTFGWTPVTAIGNQIRYDAGGNLFTVVGVVEDFHFYSLFESIAPLSLIHIKDRSTYRYLSMRLNDAGKAETIESLKAKWASLFPDAPFDYVFMEDKISQFYAVENRIYKSSRVAGVLTIIIALAGIIAFMSVSLVRRVKEISIRSVHGATPANLMLLLLKDFLWQFLIGAVLASALAFYFLSSWLTSFQFRIDLPWHTFFLVHVSILIVMSILIMGYSLSTVLRNPVKALRWE